VDKETMKTVGAFIKEKRKQKSLTQKELAQMAPCSIKTLQRIEQGIVTAYMHTIHQILPILDISFEDFECMCYGVDIRIFYSEVERTWDKGVAEKYDEMAELVIKLKEQYGELNRPTIKQVVLLLEGAVLCDKYNDCDASLTTMYKALKLTATGIVSNANSINCQKVSDRIFNLHEYRILRFIAILHAMLGEVNKSLELNKAIVVSLEKDTNDYGVQKKLMPAMYFNLSNDMINNHDYAGALVLVEKGLNCCYQTNEFTHLGNLLWNVGKASYYLGNIKKATASFKESYSFFISKKKHDTAKHLQAIAKENYKVILK